MTIKLDHADVIKKLEAVSTAIGNLSISKMPDLGKNSLDTTEK